MWLQAAGEKERTHLSKGMCHSGSDNLYLVKRVTIGKQKQLYTVLLFPEESQCPVFSCPFPTGRRAPHKMLTKIMQSMGVSLCLQATSKGLHVNLRTHLLAPGVWTGPKSDALCSVFAADGKPRRQIPEPHQRNRHQQTDRGATGKQGGFATSSHWGSMFPAVLWRFL